MDIVLKFDGDTEAMQARRALQSTKLACALHDMENALRRYAKAAEGKEAEVVDMIRDEFYQTLVGNDLILDELI